MVLIFSIVLILMATGRMYMNWGANKAIPFGIAGALIALGVPYGALIMILVSAAVMPFAKQDML